ncbi:MAG: 4'-phosphopantetheinyl transferase family protein [Hyphomicrobiaceae bacterium]
MIFDVWLTEFVRLDSARLAAYELLLSPTERKRLRLLRGEDARLQFVVGRALLKTKLAGLLGLPPQSVKFVRNPKGRLLLEGSSSTAEIAYSVSHTRDLAVCAASCVADKIGVDVEHPGSAKFYSYEFSQETLCSAELDDVNSRPKEERGRRFLIYWTLKEAYAKACGEGLNIDFRSFEFDLSGPQPQLVRSPLSDGCPWHFASQRLTSGHRLAFATVTSQLFEGLSVKKVVPLAQE